MDDGAGEIFVSIKKKAGLDLQDIMPGNKVEITGVLISNDKGLSLLPRFGGDIKKLDVGEIAEVPSSSIFVSVLKYTIPSVIAVGLGVVAYFWRMKKKLVFEGAEIIEEKIERSK